jgi:GalNAc5-diNAcBac-PP-undecaprenol beta-1,3-glucosyltransferase
MSVAATVLIPTHDHGPTLRYSVESALRQNLSDIEIFIVGDGVDDLSRSIIAELTRKDGRVRFFDFPKGERHGEASRHLALQEARGEMVAYLSDDDLWFPEHLERMYDALQRHNVVNVLGMCVDADGTLGTWYGDLNHPQYRERMRGTWNFIPLSALAHRMDFYRKLPLGWHPAPPDTWTDLHMWRKLLAHEAVDALTLFDPTVLVFPTPARASWTLQERTRELEAWMPKILETDRRAELRAAFMRAALRDRAHSDAGKEAEVMWLRASGERSGAEREGLARELEGLKAEVMELRASGERSAAEREGLARELEGLKAEVLELCASSERSAAEREGLAGELVGLKVERERLASQLQEAHQGLEASEAALEKVRADLTVVFNSATWRARERLVALPLLRQPLAWVARALAARHPRS